MTTLKFEYLFLLCYLKKGGGYYKEVYEDKIQKIKFWQSSNWKNIAIYDGRFFGIVSFWCVENFC